MILTNNRILIPISQLSQPGGLAAPPEGTGVGSIYVANSSAQPISSITVDQVAVTLPNGELDGAAPGTAPQWVTVPRFTQSVPHGPFFSSGSILEVTFINDVFWTQTISLGRFAPSASLWIWCFYNGFAVSDPNGNMAQLSWG
jgi:hypothetical protein